MAICPLYVDEGSCKQLPVVVGGLLTVSGDKAVVPMYRWRIVVHKGTDRPFRVAHAFSRFRNRARSPQWIAECGRTFAVTDFAHGKQAGDTRCLACAQLVSADSS